ncbi:hypothetical protein GcC1_155004 [Golovinomyces cichoracearum]|uniref:Uncharacterized protein n=1 Tax=Golovinomyces cichoracearum TaxID=62708 RepID=A0A420HVW7_9PEZI|nr:hypothetical protein GcC1_155004 [Golovinomyces cichoracearum]
MTSSTSQAQGARILQEIVSEARSLEEILITLRSKFPRGYCLPGLPQVLSGLYYAHTLKGPLTIKCIPTTGAATALINHILEYQLTTYCGTVALLDFTGRFNLSYLGARCGIDSLSHLHVFRPPQQSKEVFEAVKRWMLFGNHASHGKEWVGTIIIGAEGTGEWNGPERVLVSSAWNGWLNVARDEPKKYAPGTSVEEAWNQVLNANTCVSWKAWCEEGEYKWR